MRTLCLPNSLPVLVHRQGFGEIPRKIGVIAAQNAHVIGKQLERQNRQQRGDFGRRIGDDDHFAGVGVQARIVLADGDGARATAGDFVQPADDERQIGGRGGEQDRETLADGGERAVLELGREHPFAMGVGNLLQFQRAFERDGIRRAIAETIQVVPLVDVFCDRFDLRRDQLARYGLTVGDVQSVIMQAIGGENVAETVEGLARFPINLRYPREWRDTPERLATLPILTPIGLDPAHPFPNVQNKNLVLVVSLDGPDAFGRRSGIAIVQVPRVLPRIIRLPDRVSDGQQVFIQLTSVIRAHLSELFPSRTVESFSQFRVTRDSDLEVDEDALDAPTWWPDRPRAPPTWSLTHRPDCMAGGWPTA